MVEGLDLEKELDCDTLPPSQIAIRSTSFHRDSVSAKEYEESESMIDRIFHWQVVSIASFVAVIVSVNMSRRFRTTRGCWSQINP